MLPVWFTALGILEGDFGSPATHWNRGPFNVGLYEDIPVVRIAADASIPDRSVLSQSLRHHPNQDVIHLDKSAIMLARAPDKEAARLANRVWMIAGMSSPSSSSHLRWRFMFALKVSCTKLFSRFSSLLEVLAEQPGSRHEFRHLKMDSIFSWGASTECVLRGICATGGARSGGS